MSNLNEKERKELWEKMTGLSYLSEQESQKIFNRDYSQKHKWPGWMAVDRNRIKRQRQMKDRWQNQ